MPDIMVPEFDSYGDKIRHEMATAELRAEVEALTKERDGLKLIAAQVIDTSIKAREDWYGQHCSPGMNKPLEFSPNMENFWVIEFTGEHPRLPGVVNYVCMRDVDPTDNGWMDWTADIHEATQFHREKDAELFTRMYFYADMGDCAVREHIVCEPSSAMAPAERLLSECIEFRSAEYWIQSIGNGKWFLNLDVPYERNFLRDKDDFPIEFDSAADALDAYDKWKGEKT